MKLKLGEEEWRGRKRKKKMREVIEDYSYFCNEENVRLLVISTAFVSYSCSNTQISNLK